MPLVTHRGEQGCEQRLSTVTATIAEAEAVLLSVHWAKLLFCTKFCLEQYRIVA
jgi:hypothetical protein